MWRRLSSRSFACEVSRAANCAARCRVCDATAGGKEPRSPCTFAGMPPPARCDCCLGRGAFRGTRMLALKGCSGSSDPARRGGRSGESDVRGADNGPNESGRDAALPAFGATSSGSRCNPSCLGGPHCPTGQSASVGGSCDTSCMPKPGNGRGSGNGNCCVGGLTGARFGEGLCTGSQALAESSRCAGLGFGANEADLRNGEATLLALHFTGVYCPYLFTTSSS
mmetsp:Transcript_3882/g.7790  ORF Transcript_3882/g.7790 Transcript_3882/m.7790 type:complete len:224 (-) Transcript_3882:478-1149(-)|eukprot:CAMPEP_0172902854 /NCGR_PEP_ID=MMETSP1075-20121228/169265_1 /TAXON_ID=2916 /ORGANISM="Ceratium fusus, Strain PA161109" /LENGTH=223 /DNA_ID=CAMNT_0013759539 /DNA_START=14 /DNA_END=685 /DNA_ORIENTATION=-